METIQEATNFLETFFKLYPTATEEELAYYVGDHALEPIDGNYIFSELINPIFSKEGKNIKVLVDVVYIDLNTGVPVISKYNLVIKNEDNWRIIA